MSERDEKIDALLRYYHRVLMDLQESYRKAAEPYVQRIREIEAMRPRSYVIDASVLQDWARTLPNTEPKP